MNEPNIIQFPLTDQRIEKDVRRLCREQVESVAGVKAHLRPTAELLANRVYDTLDPGKTAPLLMQFSALQTLRKMCAAELRRSGDAA